MVPGEAQTVGYDAIEDVPAELWARLAGDSTLFSSRAWLRMREGELPPRGAERYLIVLGGDGSPAAGATAYAFREPPHPLYDPSRLFASAIDDELLRRLAAAPAVIGSGWSEFRGEIIADAGLSEQARMAARAQAATAVVEWSQTRSAPAVVFYYLPYEDAVAVANAFGPRHATIIYHDVEAVVYNVWRTFDEFVSALPKRRRKDVRKELGAFRDSERTVRELTLGQAIPLIAPLNCALMRKYGHDYTTERAAAVFERQAEWLDDVSSVLLAEDPQGPIGFFLRYRHAGHVYSRVAGFDYERPRQYDYFALSYEEIRHLIEEGGKSLQLGQGAVEMKVARGATPVPLYNVLVTPDSQDAAMTDRAREVSKTRLYGLAERLGRRGSGVPTQTWLPDF
jgi:hypothetical protein